MTIFSNAQKSKILKNLRFFVSPKKSLCNFWDIENPFRIFSCLRNSKNFKEISGVPKTQSVFEHTANFSSQISIVVTNTPLYEK